MVTAIRPLFAKNISSIDSNEEDAIFVVDPELGGLGRIDVRTGLFQCLLNFKHFNEFERAAALCMRPDGTIHYCRSNLIHTVSIENGSVHAATGPITIDAAQSIVGLCWKDGRYYVADVTGSLLVVENSELIRTVRIGNGINDMTLHGDRLLILRGVSRAVHIVDLDGTHVASVTVPHDGAVGIAAVKTSDAKEPCVYVYYNQCNWDVFDDAGSELTSNGSANVTLRNDARDGFIERLDYKLTDLGRGNNFCLSGGYEIEFTYAEMLKPIGDILDELEGIKLCIRLSIPVDTPRQKVKSLETIGDIPAAVTEDEEGNAIVEFDLTGIRLDKECRIFGYHAIIEAYGIRYKLNGASTDDYPADIRRRFLKEESRYDMGRQELKDIAERLLACIPTQERGNVIRIAKAVREYVYSRLGYRFNSRCSSPVETLRLGEGTCGKYMELMIGLLRLCGVACRPVGDFKVPEYKLRYVPVGSVCTPDNDHAWVEFYVPEVGWVPMESSSDGVPEKHDRFFGALSWVYIENSRTDKMCKICKPGSWENIDQDLRYSELFIPEIQIRILKALRPSFDPSH